MQKVRESLSGIQAITPFSKTRVIDVQNDLHNAIGNQAPTALPGYFNGEKFLGGFGETYLYEMDYWTLRARSAQVFDENPYAVGILRRLVTNEINTGLTPEALPEEKILGKEEDELAEWSEDVETRFQLYAGDKELCDYKGEVTFDEMQATVRMEALICGDILVILTTDDETGLPLVRLLDGNAIVTPISDNRISKTTKIEEGIEFDKRGRHAAYWVEKDDGTFDRIPAYGPKSGRRIAWMVYGIEKRMTRHRGTPFLALILQSLKEMDRYRDATLRKAVIQSILAMFIKKTEDKMATTPISNGAIRRGSVVIGGENEEACDRKFSIAENTPGMVIEELQQGEEPVGFKPEGTDAGFGIFEKAMIATIAWVSEIPPQVLELDFSNSYSASQAATNEFKIYLNKARKKFANSFCRPVYEEWLLSSVINGEIKAKGLFEAFIDPKKHAEYNAWIQTDWSGAIKPSVDLLKQVNAYGKLVDRGWITNDQASKELTGKKFSKNVKRLARENEQLVKANKVLVDARIENGAPEGDLATMITDTVTDVIQEAITGLKGDE